MVVITYSVHRRFVDFLSTYISMPFESIAVERPGLIIQSIKVKYLRYMCAINLYACSASPCLALRNSILFTHLY